MVAGLHLDVGAKVLGHPDPRVALRAVLHAWLPLPEAVLGMAVEHLPDPAVRTSHLKKIVRSLSGYPESEPPGWQTRALCSNCTSM